MKKLLFLFVITVIGGCQDVKKPEPPEDLIALEKMADIMTEIYLGNAAKSVNNRIIRQSGVKLDSFVYSKFGIDSMQFVRSNAYYTSDLNTYNKLFKAVEERLIALKEINDSLNAKPPGGNNGKADSTQTKGQLIESPDPDA